MGFRTVAQDCICPVSSNVPMVRNVNLYHGKILNAGDEGSVFFLILRHRIIMKLHLISLGDMY